MYSLVSTFIWIKESTNLHLKSNSKNSMMVQKKKKNYDNMSFVQMAFTLMLNLNEIQRIQ